MDFKVNIKTQAQYNWKFYVKLTLGLIPLASIIIFFSAQLADLVDDPAGFWTYIFEIKANNSANRLDQFKNMEPFPITYDTNSTGEVIMNTIRDNWDLGHKIEYGIFRNLGMITTLGNIFACTFFLDSAVHNSKEGVGYKNGGGVLDTYRAGLAMINVQTFIVLAYNLSLMTGDAVKIMKWYNYVSWMCEHLVVPIMMIAYFFAFYPKNSKSCKEFKKDKVRNWWSFMWSSSALTWVYQVFFIALGFILKAGHAFPIFGDMSSNGYFPYNYMDFSKSNLTSAPMGMSHAVEFVLAEVAIVVEQIITFEIFWASMQHQMKLDIKRQYWK